MEKDVKETSVSPEVVSEDKKTQEETDTQEVAESTQETETTETETPQEAGAGTKTDSALLLKSLQQERDKRRQLEARLQELETSVSSDTFSDEGVQKEVRELRQELSQVKSELTKKDILISHPVLKDKWEELEEFRLLDENKGMNLRTAAKAFLVENGLLDAPRKGLERPTGGKPTLTPGMTAEDVKNLRQTNYKKYQELLAKGQLKVQ